MDSSHNLVGEWVGFFYSYTSYLGEQSWFVRPGIEYMGRSQPKQSCGESED